MEIEDVYNNKKVKTDQTVEKENTEKTLNINPRESYSYIGKNIKIKIDRPLNSRHPKHGFIYPINYGYVPDTLSGDGEELDAYILGVDKPLEEFDGICIAVIHRLNDDDDKLIVVEPGKKFTNEEIRKYTDFQEKFFKSEIIR